ncbi:MAG: ABC transporter ATP-binding protein [Thermoleophilia bacterium]|nr:ABC transporter ATP-binding protein [Thermoleophilia bacterium]
MLAVRDAHVGLGGHPALAGIDLEVAAGTVVAVLGPSGSGKSTLLRAITGLQSLDRGSIELDGGSLAGVPPHRRGIGLMFQDDALFPHRDVAANVGFGLRMQSVSNDAIAARVTEMLALVGLAGKEHRSIGSLSGGERKRVALARALAPAPRVLLLDEPLGALDRPLHDRLVTELGRLFRAIGQTTVYVTHDVAEAFALGDSVAVMREGRVVQVAAPEELWATPRDAWIARFIGLANVEVRGRTAVVTRPEGVTFRLDPAGEAVVVSSRRDGPLVTLCARYDSGAEIVSAHTGTEPPAPGDRVRVAIDPAAVGVIPTESQARDQAQSDPA